MGKFGDLHHLRGYLDWFDWLRALTVSDRDKLSFPISCDRSSIAGDGTAVGTVAGMGAGVGANDGTNDGNDGTAVVLGTRTEGITGAGAMEVNKFGMSRLTGPPADWTINSLSSLLYWMFKTSSITTLTSRSSDSVKFFPRFHCTSIWSSSRIPPKNSATAAYWFSLF